MKIKKWLVYSVGFCFISIPLVSTVYECISLGLILGFSRGILNKTEKRDTLDKMQDSYIKCMGNNGNGCYLDSCGHNCGCGGIKK